MRYPTPIASDHIRQSWDLGIGESWGLRELLLYPIIYIPWQIKTPYNSFWRCSWLQSSLHGFKWVGLWKLRTNVSDSKRHFCFKYRNSKRHCCFRDIAVLKIVTANVSFSFSMICSAWHLNSVGYMVTGGVSVNTQVVAFTSVANCQKISNTWCDGQRQKFYVRMYDHCFWTQRASLWTRGVDR